MGLTNKHASDSIENSLGERVTVQNGNKIPHETNKISSMQKL